MADDNDYGKNKKQKTTVTSISYAGKLPVASASASASASSTLTLEDVMLELINIKKELTTAKEELKKEATTSKEIITKKIQDEIKSLKDQYLSDKEKEYVNIHRNWRLLKNKLAAGKEFITNEVDSLKQQLLLLKEEKVNNNDNDDDDVNNNDDYDDDDNEGDGSVVDGIILEDESADDKYYQRWKINYKLLKKYVNKNDGKIPNYRCEVDGIKIGGWVHNQRKIYNFLKSNPGKACRYGKMTKRRKDDLEKFESWTWYLKKSGNIKDDDDDEDDEEEDDDEAEVKDDEAEVVEEVVEEEEDGSSVGTVIDLEDEAADGIYYKKWKKNYKLLEKYVDDNDGKIPTHKCEVDGIKLGNWVQNQRNSYNFLKSNPGQRCGTAKMTKRRKDDLEKIESWTWEKNSKKKETSVVVV